jgi:predicted YcjX-like family ATPase
MPRRRKVLKQVSNVFKERYAELHEIQSVKMFYKNQFNRLDVNLLPKLSMLFVHQKMKG